MEICKWLSFVNLNSLYFTERKIDKHEDYPDEMDDDIEDNWEIMSLASNCSFFFEHREPKNWQYLKDIKLVANQYFIYYTYFSR